MTLYACSEHGQREIKGLVNSASPIFAAFRQRDQPPETNDSKPIYSQKSISKRNIEWITVSLAGELKWSPPSRLP